MSLLSLVITIIVVGVLLWLVTTYVPMDATVKRILVGVVIVVLVLWILRAFGLFAYAERVRL